MVLIRKCIIPRVGYQVGGRATPNMGVGGNRL